MPYHFWNTSNVPPVIACGGRYRAYTPRFQLYGVGATMTTTKRVSLLLLRNCSKLHSTR